MELRHLRYFVAVAEERHFGRAAERVGIGQPPLSQQIQALKRELGTQLIRRIPRNIELTDAGEVLLREARLILAQTEHAIACVGRASRGELGKLRIGLTPAASFNSFVTEAMDAFHKLYPDILIALTESDSAALFHALAEGDIDVAFTPPPVSDDRIALDELFEEALMVALPVSHALASLPALSMKSLADQDFVLIPRELAPAAYDCLIAACKDAGFSPRIVQEAPQMATAINLIAVGVGLTVVPASLRHVHPGEVVYLPVEDAVLSASICLASRRGEPAVPVRNFVKLARKWDIVGKCNSSSKSGRVANLARIAIEDGLEVFTEAGRMPLARALIEAALRAPPKALKTDAWTKLVAGLRFDGFEVDEEFETEEVLRPWQRPSESTTRVLRRMMPEDLPGLDFREAENEVELLLTRHGFSVAQGHLRQAVSAFSRGEWSSANGALRNFYESYLNEIAVALGYNGSGDGKAKRDFLGTTQPPFLFDDYNEWNANNQKPQYVQGLMSRMHPHGGHPGLSEEEDATFRLQISLVTARLFLRRFNQRKLVP